MPNGLQRTANWLGELEWPLEMEWFCHYADWKVLKLPRFAVNFYQTRWFFWARSTTHSIWRRYFMDIYTYHFCIRILNKYYSCSTPWIGQIAVIIVFSGIPNGQMLCYKLTTSFHLWSHRHSQNAHAYCQPRTFTDQLRDNNVDQPWINTLLHWDE